MNVVSSAVPDPVPEREPLLWAGLPTRPGNGPTGGGVGRPPHNKRACLILLVWLVALGLRAHPAWALEGSFALRAGKIYPVSGPVIEGGTIVVRDGKIVRLGKDVEVPPDVPLLELPRHVIIPGLVDAETSLTGEARDGRKSLAPEILAADGWDFFADRRSLLKGGVTTVYVSPGISLSAGELTRLVSGRGCVVKVAGAKGDPLSRLLKKHSGLQITLGELPKRPPSIYDPPVAASPDNPFEILPTQLPQSRPGQFLALRGLLAEARVDGVYGEEARADEVRGDRARADEVRGDRPHAKAAIRGANADSDVQLSPPQALTPEMAALRPLLSGEDYLRVRANRARDILQILRFSEAHGLKMVLEGGREADLLAEELAAANVPVIFDGGFQPGVITRGDLSVETVEGRYREQALLTLAEARVKVILNSPTDQAVENLILQAASAVRVGLDPDAALKSITLDAAEVLQVDDRVGSLEPGKDADLVILGGEPFSEGSSPQAVYIGGELVYHDGPVDLDADVTVIRCGKVWTGTGEQFPGGVIVLEEKKIHYVGPGVLTAHLSPRAKILDASAEVVVPGFIDAATSVGAHAETLALQMTAKAGSLGGVGRSTFRLADAIDSRDPNMLELLRAGITTVLLSPEPVTPVAGQIAAWKLSRKSREEVELKPYAALLLRSNVPTTLLNKAKKYHEGWKAYEAKSPAEGKEEGKAEVKEPERQEQYEPFRPLFEREIPAVVFGESEGALLGAIKTLSGQFGMKVVVAGYGRFDRIADELARQGVGGLLSVPLIVKDGPRKVNVPRQAAAAGMRFAFRSGAATGAREIVPQVTLAVHDGWSLREALAAMTIRPAQIFGLDEQVGSIEEGKDADLVFLSGEPFAMTTRVVRVMVEGEMVSDF